MILHAARTIVAEEGVEALKVRRIAMDIGYTVGSIYMLFDSLADVVLEVKGQVLDELASCLSEVCASVDDPKQAVSASAKAYLFFASQHYHLWSLLFDRQSQYEKELLQWYQEKVDSLFAKIEAFFRQMTPSATEAEVRQGARALWSGVHGVCAVVDRYFGYCWCESY